MHPSDFDDVPTEVLIEMALHKMRAQISWHKQYLVVMGIARQTAKMAIEKDVPPASTEEALVKNLVTEPGRLDDPRIATLPDEMAERVWEFEARLNALTAPEDLEIQEWQQLTKDIKQLNADMEPVYAWHAEMRRDLVRRTAEMN